MNDRFTKLTEIILHFKDSPAINIAIPKTFLRLRREADDDERYPSRANPIIHEHTLTGCVLFFVRSVCTISLCAVANKIVHNKCTIYGAQFFVNYFVHREVHIQKLAKLCAIYALFCTQRCAQVSRGQNCTQRAKKICVETLTELG